MTTGVDQCPSGGALGGLPAPVMSDFDDTQYWDGSPWEGSGEISAGPPARTTGTHRVNRTRRHQIERTRSHHIVISTRTPDDAYDDLDGDWTPVDHWVETQERAPRLGLAGVDPKLIRIGTVAAAGLLMIPIALALRDKPADGMRTEAVAPTTTVAIVAPPVAVASPTTVVMPPVTVAAAPVTAAAAPSPAPAVQAAAAAAVKPSKPACAGKYTVILNDYWNRFPKTSGASVAQWLAANNATADTPLYVGDELCIPAGATAPEPPPTTTQPPTTTAAPAATAAPVVTAALAAPVTQAPATTRPPATTQPPATTTAPVVTIAPPPTRGAVVPAPALDAASVEAIIREVWPDELEDHAIAIATRESKLNPSVHNWCCYGVFAIYFDMGKNFLPQMGITSSDQLLDARTNITAAYKLYTLAGWGPWDL
jgi:LysM repeat protein